MISAALAPLALGLLGAILIGCSDVIARVTARRIAIIALMTAVFAAPVAPLWLWLDAIDRLPPADLERLAPAIGSGVANVLGLGLLYAALRRGPVALVSPTVGSFSVMLVAANALAGAPITFAQIAAIGVVFLGVAMLTRPDPAIDGAADAGEGTPGGDLRVTLAFSLASALSIAARMFWAQDAVDEIGALETLLATRATSFTLCAVALAAFLFRGGRLVQGRLDRPLLALALLQAALESASLAAFLLGGDAGDGMAGRVAAAIGFSSFAAVSPIAAWLWLGDPIGPRRAVWIGVVVGGVILSTLGGG